MRDYYLFAVTYYWFIKMNINLHANHNENEQKDQQELNDRSTLDLDASHKQKMEKAFKKTMIVFLCLLLFFSLISDGFFFTALFSIFYLAITIIVFGKKQGLQKGSSTASHRRINPASGLPMIGGVDLHGNAYGSRHSC